jgi:hypothetical protein
MAGGRGKIVSVQTTNQVSEAFYTYDFMILFSALNIYVSACEPCQGLIQLVVILGGEGFSSKRYF